MIVSDLPPAYTSALSKKLMPASYAAARQSRAVWPASCGPKLTQEPNERALTFRPERPRRRYCMSIARGYGTGPPDPRAHRASWARPPPLACRNDDQRDADDGNRRSQRRGSPTMAAPTAGVEGIGVIVGSEACMLGAIGRGPPTREVRKSRPTPPGQRRRAFRRKSTGGLPGPPLCTEIGRAHV